VADHEKYDCKEFSKFGGSEIMEMGFTEWRWTKFYQAILGGPYESMASNCVPNKIRLVEH